MTFRRWRTTIGTAAALFVLLAHMARADVDGGAALVDARVVTAVSDAGADAAAAPSPAPAPAELPRPTELPAASATSVATAMLARPTPAETEPPRPITKRLWFWLAVTGVVAGAVLIGIAVRNPTHTQPDCPPDYVCPP